MAVVELDQIVAMALPTLPSWAEAHGIFAMVAGAWARSTLSCVIAEGPGSSAEVVELLDHAPAGAVTVTVAVSTALEVACARAQLDPTRQISRDHDFLRTVYDSWPAELSRVEADVVVDTGTCSVEEAVAVVQDAITLARVGREGYRRSVAHPRQGHADRHRPEPAGPPCRDSERAHSGEP